MNTQQNLPPALDSREVRPPSLLPPTVCPSPARQTLFYISHSIFTSSSTYNIIVNCKPQLVIAV